MDQYYTYLPTDPLTFDFDDSELIDILSEVETIIDETSFDGIIWNGDINWHMARKSGFSKEMRNFVDRLGLVSLWEYFPVDYTHIHTDNVSTATLGHFIVNERLIPLVRKTPVSVSARQH